VLDASTLLDVALLIVVSGGIVYLAMLLRAKRHAREAAAARAAENRFRGLTELSADWFWETDAEHRITWLSGGAPVATFFGITPTFGKRLWEIPRVEIDPRALEDLRERLEKRQNFDVEIARADERGARQIHIVSGSARFGAKGEFRGYRGVARDVTEQRRAEQALAQAKARLELALDGGNLAEWHFDVAGDELYAGDGWVRFLGHDTSPARTRGRALSESMHEEDRARVKDALIRVLKGELAEFEAEFRIATKSGEWKWLHAKGRVTDRDSAGRARRMSGMVADIDARKRAEQALAEREKRFRDVVEASGEYVWETDTEWRYTYLSERVETVLGYSRAELLGRSPREFMPLGELRATEEWFARHSAEGLSFRDMVHRSITKSGGVIWQSVSAVPVHDAASRWMGYRGTAADVTARKQAEARIEYLATRDALTGLPNRVLLADRAGQAILVAARGRSQLALLCIDLDRFKLVNDTLGHAAGDALLRAVAERLSNTLRREDTLARFGGDDFVLLWNGLKSAEDAGVLAGRILALLARPFTVDGHTLNVGASLGISIYPNDGRDFAELLKNADAAMYHAKESGRGTFRFFSPHLNARARERLSVENELRSALARSELVLHWHPVIRGRGELVGAEALVRWNHPERGLLLPEDFVPLAEECGLIRAVGEWTLERALSRASAWHRAGLWFAINVSAAELAQGDAYVERLRTCLRANGLPGSAVELEITERVLLSHFGDNAQTLERIGELGVRFAIDDFGTGYSSLAYLRMLPINKLKIDRSFLRELDTHAADEAIVRAIAAMAKTLGIAVAAEGVETAAQLERLLELGCEEWQGHYYSEPLDAPSFEKLFSSALLSARTARRSEA
jgi:diguanylate cyclase (GGDEF)-like protein/PAS domain S-box-containing protein